MITFQVPRLFRPPLNLDDIDELASKGVRLRLENQWPAKPKQEAAEVWLGHTGGHLHVLARIPDAHVVCRAYGPNQRMWELGDTFEIFLHAGGMDHYFEFHVTPPNHRMQLRLPASASLDDASFERNLLPDPAFRSETRIEPFGWTVLATIVAATVEVDSAPLAGREWTFSFCRYDYDSIAGKPVLSSTTPHAELNFHHRHEWGRLRFAD